ncbi:MAG: class I SAM-dependent DNA methyltransferase [Sarcina sp.]
MNKMKDFFNERAKDWDSHSIPDRVKMEYILKKANLKEHANILDIACGTGVMEEFLLEKNPNSILAVDLAENMIQVAKNKYNDKRIKFMVQDVMTLNGETFDFIMLYNAFPHFLEPEKFLKKIYSLLNKDGKFVICHGMGRKDLNHHHERKANEISLGLAPAVEVAEMVEKVGLKVDYIEDIKEIYIVSCVK